MCIRDRPTSLQENTFVYELYNGNNERISSGNFSDKKQGDTICLLYTSRCV